MSEANLNKKVKDWINSIPGCWAYKRRGGPGNRGMPDISGCVGPVRVEIEGKLEGNEPTAKQTYFIELFKRQGCIAGWYTSLEQAQQIVSTEAAAHGFRIVQTGKKWDLERIKNDSSNSN
jgi:hypothetical protein